MQMLEVHFLTCSHIKNSFVSKHVRLTLISVHSSYGSLGSHYLFMEILGIEGANWDCIKTGERRPKHLAQSLQNAW